jgi:hypothetical protein
MEGLSYISSLSKLRRYFPKQERRGLFLSSIIFLFILFPLWWSASFWYAELSLSNERRNQEIEERTAEMEEKIAEIERMNRLFIGRELRMKEPKESIKELEAGIQE